MRKIWLFLIFSSFISLWGQETIPDSYRNIKLGMSRAEVENLLTEDPYFIYKKGTKTSLRDEAPRDIIECEGSEFIAQAYFHFSQGELVLFTLTLNRDKIDYFSLFNDFSNKWGEPDHFSSTEGIWDSGSYRVSLIKPLIVRYAQNDFLDRIGEEQGIKQNYFESRREAFLEDF